MAVSLTHATEATGTDSADGRVSKNAWNEEHELTAAESKLLGTVAASTTVGEITLGTSLALTASTLDVVTDAIQDIAGAMATAGANVTVAYDDGAGTLTIAAPTEGIQDIVGAMAAAGANTTVAYDDGAGTLTIAAPTEGIQDIVGAMVVAGDNITATYDDGANTLTIAAPAVSTAYDIVADVEAATIDVDIQCVRTNGYSEVGDGGHGFYKRMAAAPYDAANSGFLRSVDRYTSAGATDNTNGGYWELVPDASGLRVEQFGGAGDYWVVTRTVASTVNPSPTDNRAALLEAIDYLYTHVDVASGGDPKIATGATIRLGYGGYYFSDEITFDRTTCIQGMGTANYHDGAASRCYFAAGKKGFVFDHYSAGPYGTGASILRDVFIQSLGFGGQTTKHGIDINANVHIENVAVRGFGGNGIDISADITGGTNANCFYLSRIFTYDNAGHGVYCTGGDSNAGVGVQINAMANGGYGIRDDSFLGNTWLACHTAGNTTGAYYMIGVNSRSVMVGCYSESDQPESYFGPKCMVLGGLGAAGADITDGALVAGDGGFSGRVSFFNHPDDTNDGILRLRPAADKLIEFNADAIGFSYALRYRSTIPAFTLQYSESENHALWLTTGATVLAGRSALEANCPLFPKGVWLGDSSLNQANFRNISYGTAAPGSGAWARGDRVYDLAPSAGGTEGWVCTSGGSPGTWKAFGTIAA
jgi:hypothetical protein